jgi:hypothetical protein
MFPTVGRVADESLTDRIDDEIECFERDLADQHGAFVGQFRDFDETIAALHRELDGPIHPELRDAAAGDGLARAEPFQAELLDVAPRQR